MANHYASLTAARNMPPPSPIKGRRKKYLLDAVGWTSSTLPIDGRFSWWTAAHQADSSRAWPAPTALQGGHRPPFPSMAGSPGGLLPTKRIHRGYVPLLQPCRVGIAHPFHRWQALLAGSAHPGKNTKITKTGNSASLRPPLRCGTGVARGRLHPNPAAPRNTAHGGIRAPDAAS